MRFVRFFIELHRNVGNIKVKRREKNERMNENEKYEEEDMP